MRGGLVASLPESEPGGTRPPPLVRRAGWSVLGVLLAGAAYLILVRGEAMIVDLSALAGKVWCF